MKFSMKMVILSMAGVLALGGAATAASFIFNEVSKSGTVTADGAFLLSWGDNDTFKDVTNLTYGTPVEQILEAKWSKSSLVSGGNVVFTFTLSNAENLKVEISEKDWETVSEEEIKVLSGDGSVVIETSAVETSSKTIYLRYSLNTYSDQAFSASFNANVSYAAEE